MTKKSIRKPLTSTQHGSVMTALLLILFLGSLAAASFVAFLLWRDSRGPRLEQSRLNEGVVSASNGPATSLDPLAPEFSVAPELQSAAGDFRSHLLDPLRAYYATKTERLGRVRVEAAPNDKHSARVTFAVTDKDGAVKTFSFFYDRAGKEHTGPYPAWEPGMLDNTK